MRKLHILGLALALISLPVLAACVPFPFGGPGGGTGPGMMGGQGGSGMMGGGWGNYNPDSNARPITIDQAADSVQDYITAYGGKLVLTEVMDFAWNYYAEVEEKDTGIHAMELFIDKYTGRA